MALHFDTRSSSGCFDILMMAQISFHGDLASMGPMIKNGEILASSDIKATGMMGKISTGNIVLSLKHHSGAAIGYIYHTPPFSSWPASCM